MDTEIWLPVVGYEGYYSVSNFGDVIGLKYYKIRIPGKNKGYLRVDLWKGGKCKNMTIHRIVAQAFIPNPENKPDVNHKDGNKENNRIDNLEWVTKSENTLHAFTKLNRTVLKGESHGMYGKENPNSYFIKKYAHLEDRNKEIYRKLKEGEGPYILAKVYKCSPQTIYNIKKRYETRTQSI